MACPGVRYEGERVYWGKAAAWNAIGKSPCAKKKKKKKRVESVESKGTQGALKLQKFVRVKRAGLVARRAVPIHAMKRGKRGRGEKNSVERGRSSAEGESATETRIRRPAARKKSKTRFVKRKGDKEDACVEKKSTDRDEGVVSHVKGGKTVPVKGTGRIG